MEEVTARVYLVSISRSRYSAVYVGGHAKTALLHAAISAAAHQMCEMLMNVQFQICRDERSELLGLQLHVDQARAKWYLVPGYLTVVNLHGSDYMPWIHGISYVVLGTCISTLSQMYCMMQCPFGCQKVDCSWPHKG